MSEPVEQIPAGVPGLWRIATRDSAHLLDTGCTPARWMRCPGRRPDGDTGRTPADGRWIEVARLRVLHPDGDAIEDALPRVGVHVLVRPRGGKEFGATVVTSIRRSTADQSGGTPW